jgi:hypothetical protein
MHVEGRWISGPVFDNWIVGYLQAVSSKCKQWTVQSWMLTTVFEWSSY